LEGRGGVFFQTDVEKKKARKAKASAGSGCREADTFNQ
jgi:hypothetical protein